MDPSRIPQRTLQIFHEHQGTWADELQNTSVYIQRNNGRALQESFHQPTQVFPFKKSLNLIL